MIASDKCFHLLVLSFNYLILDTEKVLPYRKFFSAKLCQKTHAFPAHRFHIIKDQHITDNMKRKSTINTVPTGNLDNIFLKIKYFFGYGVSGLLKFAYLHLLKYNLVANNFANKLQGKTISKFATHTEHRTFFFTFFLFPFQRSFVNENSRGYSVITLLAINIVMQQS